MGIYFPIQFSKVQRLQNRAARIITGEIDYIHVRGIDIVKNLKWMNVIQRRDYFVALSMFKCIHGMSPSYLSDCITMYNGIAVRYTRASCTQHQPDHSRLYVHPT